MNKEDLEKIIEFADKKDRLKDVGVMIGVYQALLECYDDKTRTKQYAKDEAFRKLQEIYKR